MTPIIVQSVGTVLVFVFCLVDAGRDVASRSRSTFRRGVVLGGGGRGVYGGGDIITASSLPHKDQAYVVSGGYQVADGVLDGSFGGVTHGVGGVRYGYEHEGPHHHHHHHGDKEQEEEGFRGHEKVPLSYGGFKPIINHQPQKLQQLHYSHPHSHYEEGHGQNPYTPPTSMGFHHSEEESTAGRLYYPASSSPTGGFRNPEHGHQQGHGGPVHHHLRMAPNNNNHYHPLHHNHHGPQQANMFHRHQRQHSMTRPRHHDGLMTEHRGGFGGGGFRGYGNYGPSYTRGLISMNPHYAHEHSSLSGPPKGPPNYSGYPYLR